MFIQIFTTLMSHRRTSALAFPRLTGAHLTRALKDAEQAMLHTPVAMSLSERIRKPDKWILIQQARREALLRLLLVEPTPAFLQQATDLVAEIVEESSWSRNTAGTAFDDENHPVIDDQCTQTAMLLAWTAHLIGNKLDGSVIARIRNEVRRRLFKPIAAHEDYDFMRGIVPCPMVMASDILLSALLLENDEARISRVVRPALKLLDDACGRHGRELAPLSETLADISAITDLVFLLREMTSRRVDLTDRIPVGDWLDEILFSWIQDETFNDPAGSNMNPVLSGSDVFRIGAAVRDEQLTELGSSLYHSNHIPSLTVTGRLMEGTVCETLESTFGKPQRLRYSTLRNNLLMTSRVTGLYCSMHVGGGRGNAGDICLFADGKPILVDGGHDCPIRSLPVIAGRGQLQKPERTSIADFEVRSDREIMSVDLSSAYPPACGIRSCQRTLMTLRSEHTVRIMDAIDLRQPAPVTFNFVCAAEPIMDDSALRLGSMIMRWEGDLAIRTAPIGSDLYMIELISREPVRQGFFAFNFERA